MNLEPRSTRLIRMEKRVLDRVADRCGYPAMRLLVEARILVATSIYRVRDPLLFPIVRPFARNRH